MEQYDTAPKKQTMKEFPSVDSVKSLSQFGADSSQLISIRYSAVKFDSNTPPPPFPDVVDVTFRIKMRLEFGQSLSIIGNCKELGNWNDAGRARLEWSSGDIWHATVTMRQPFFSYKYAVIDGSN